jgi:hypothetical protein
MRIYGMNWFSDKIDDMAMPLRDTGFSPRVDKPQTTGTVEGLVGAAMRERNDAGFSPREAASPSTATVEDLVGAAMQARGDAGFSPDKTPRNDSVQDIIDKVLREGNNPVRGMMDRALLESVSVLPETPKLGVTGPETEALQRYLELLEKEAGRGMGANPELRAAVEVKMETPELKALPEEPKVAREAVTAATVPAAGNDMLKGMAAAMAAVDKMDLSGLLKDTGIVATRGSNLSAPVVGGGGGNDVGKAVV